MTHLVPLKIPYSGCNTVSKMDWASLLSCLIMIVLFLLILGGNLATMITIGSERKKSSYQYLQMSLCCADIILAISGPLVSASVTLMFLTGVLEPGDFLTANLFHRLLLGQKLKFNWIYSVLPFTFYLCRLYCFEKYVKFWIHILKAAAEYIQFMIWTKRQ